MINFCTLFDSNYLSRGLALHASLRKVCASFHLYVLAFNEECYDYLSNAKLQNLTVISLSDFEDDELLKIKSTRSAAEYCWTCTPSIILFCIAKYNLPSCTYIDADMIFYHNPSILLEEMGQQSILLTEHKYTKDYDQSKKSGIYCVQFMCFKQTPDGMKALTWWRERCIEWCYARHEDGKFGDQKYLDDWPERFKGVHVLQNPGGGVAPWNLQKFNFFKKNNSVYFVEKKSCISYPLIFFHFHGVKFYTDQYISCCEALYQIDSETKKLIYLPYFRYLMEIEDRLNKEGVKFNVNGARTVSPKKANIILQYLKDVFATLKMGNISFPSLHLLNINKHNHFYKFGFIRNNNGRTDRS